MLKVLGWVGYIVVYRYEIYSLYTDKQGKVKQGSVACSCTNSIVVLDCKNYEVRGVVDVVVVDAPGVKPFRFFNLLNILLRSRVNLWGWIYGVNKTADKQGKADASSCSNSIVVIG